MPNYHLAQVNIARMKGPLDSPVMAGFVARLEEINAVADGSPGFVWRLQTDAGASSTYLRPYEDDRIIINLSVWESAATFRDYVYQSAHGEALRHRREWFEHFAGVAIAMWWVPVGHIPGVDEARKRLAHLEQHGPSQFAFGFKSILEPDPAYIDAFDWSTFEPCRAA